jgi:hypothetical protein
MPSTCIAQSLFVKGRALADDMVAVMQRRRSVGEQRGEPVLALDQWPRAEILTVEIEQIEQEENQCRGVAAVGRQLNNVERGEAVGADAAQFAVEIGLARIERRHGLGDGRIFVGPVEPGARQQFDRAAVKARMHTVAVVFDFM